MPAAEHGMEGDGFPESLAHDLHQLAQADTIGMVGDQFDDFVAVDGGGV
jgi:hypothetical protein